jgi:hypothetical protein
MGYLLQGPFNILGPRIRKLETGLKRRHPRVAACRVSVEDRPPRAYERRRFNVRLDVSFAGGELVVNREHDDNPGVALREAFDAASRRLKALEATKFP